MSVLNLMKTRRTYRRFEQRPVPDEVISEILEAARLSSSAANLQPLKYLVIRTPELVLPPHQMGRLPSSGTGRPQGKRASHPLYPGPH